MENVIFNNLNNLYASCLSSPLGLYMFTPYSTNSLFSELFKTFGGVLLELCETIWGSCFGYFGAVLGAILELGERFRSDVQK